MYCFPNTSETSLQDARKNLENNIKDMHVLAMSQDLKIRRHEIFGREALENGDEERAEIEARLAMQEAETRSVYLSVFEKSSVLLKELEKVSTLAICANVLKQSSIDLGVTLNTNLNINDVDKTMARMQQQLKQVRNVDRSMTRSNKTKKTTPLLEPLPELPNAMDYKIKQNIH